VGPVEEFSKNFANELQGSAQAFTEGAQAPAGVSLSHATATYNEGDR
jgi:hypothetical protein